MVHIKSGDDGMGSAHELKLHLLAANDWKSHEWVFPGAADEPPVTIGRADHSRAQLPDRSVSSDHALIARWTEPAEGWFLQDRGSSNGSYLRLSVPRKRSRAIGLTAGHRFCAGSCAVEVLRFPAAAAATCGRRPSMEVSARSRPR